MAQDLIFDLSPTQNAFVHSDAIINHLTGPMGEGKTHCAIARLLFHAYRCKLKPLQAAIVRDTHQNIKTSTAMSIKEILGDRAVFKDDYKKLYIKAEYPVECDLFGIDDEASISKLQGPQYGTIWLEEPAPIIEKANAGLPIGVFEMALSRCGRQSGSIPNLQITQNPADDEHWTSELDLAPEEYMIADDGTVITKKSFHIKKGENKYLTPLQRAMNQAAFKNDPGKYARYVEGKTASVSRGIAVTPGYSADFHFSQKILPFYDKLETFRFWDGYQHPSCIIAQWSDTTPDRQLVLHEALEMPGYGVKELIGDKLDPLMLSPKYKDKKNIHWRDIGDPSMTTPDQSTSNMTAAKTIEARFKTHFEKGPTRWGMRIDPLTQALRRNVSGGRPLITVSASAYLLHRALNGGWHYKKDNNGKRLGTLPVQDQFDHPSQALCYGVAIVIPYSSRQEYQQATQNINREARMKRAISYGGAAHHRFPGNAGMVN
ncbi:MAG: hypothetical protein ABFD76_05130 [Smithella sp.]